MKKVFFILIAIVALAMSNNSSAQTSNEDRAVALAMAAVRQECGIEPGPFFSGVESVPCAGGGSEWVIHFSQPTPCFPLPFPCIQVVQPIATVTVDCDYHVTSVSCDGFPIIIIE